MALKIQRSILRTGKVAKRMHLHPGSVRRMAKRGTLPAAKDRRRWVIDTNQWEAWWGGGAYDHDFFVAHDPEMALRQVQRLIEDICLPFHWVDYQEEEAQQRRLKSVISTILQDPRYRKIVPAVRKICLRFRQNPALGVLETIPGLFPSSPKPMGKARRGKRLGI